MSDSVELDLQVVVNCLVWALGIEHGISVRSASTLQTTESLSSTYNVQVSERLSFFFIMLLSMQFNSILWLYWPLKMLHNRMLISSNMRALQRHIT